MKIENCFSKTVPFSEVPMGHVFYDHNGNWYLKCESVVCGDYNELVNAVSIENGELESFPLKQDVYPVIGKFVAENIGFST